MNPKLQFIRNIIGLWTLLGVTISMLAMFLLAGPGDMCPVLDGINNNYFGEYWIEIILMVNAILYGIGMTVWTVRMYRDSQKPKESEEDEWE